MRRAFYLLLILALLLPAAPPARAQVDPAQALLERMTPDERVGQLFIVSFVGDDAGAGSDIAQLIQQEEVGGAVLLAANQNFVNDQNAPQQVRATSAQLQNLALSDGPLPLLIAIDHEGDGWPYSRLTGGTTPLPSPMAIGATWNPDLAREVGRITGAEMAAAGINMILGPDVDVLSDPAPTGKGDLGTRVFGGDPYWVGRMGRAYIAGVHEGAAGRMATVAKHFPGHGGSDRLPDDEVATVDKSLQELRRIELAPFFAVTRFDQPDDSATTDALMSSHIRYRGFQGNIRQFTAPISFDPVGLRTILAEQEFDDWRERGVIVSDSLGVPAVRRYFDPTGASFPHRQVARDALMAGNDLLILAQFALDDSWPSQLANMRDTLAFFREQVRADRAFAARVDQAALRVIRLKLKLYPEFAEAGAALPALPEPRWGQDGAVTETVAEQALTLLFPRTPEELDERLPRAPQRGEPIVIFTDTRRVRDCFDCPYYPLIPTDALQQAILRRYGPAGTGQINEAQVISFSFEDLKLFVGAPGTIEGSDDPEAAARRAGAVRDLVERAGWVLLVMQDINLSPVSGTQQPRYPESDAARLLLDAAAGSLLNKRVVAFAFNVPYQLDTTEISKLTAAFALFSKQPAFIEVAARALFRDIQPQGALPVTVDAVGYDLPTQLGAAPEQALMVERLGSAPLLLPTEVEVQTTTILDHNGNPVPDGTTVEFVGTWRTESETPPPRLPAITTDGVARATLALRAAGLLEVRAIAGPVQSEPLMLSIAGPTPTPTRTPLPSATPRPDATPRVAAFRPVDATAQGTDAAAPTPTPPPPAPRDALPLAALWLGLASAGVVAGAGWWGGRAVPLNGRVRAALLAVIGGVGGFLLWGMVGAAGGGPGAALAALGGALLGRWVDRRLTSAG